MAGFIADNVSIHPQAEIAEDVEIGPFSVVGAGLASAAALGWKTTSRSWAGSRSASSTTSTPAW